MKGVLGGNGMIRLLAIGLATVGFIACGSTTQPGGGPGSPDGGDPNAWSNPTPVLMVVSSQGDIAVGDAVSLIGNQFIPPLRGKNIVHFRGVFSDVNGQQHPVDKTFTARHQDPTKLSWRLYPDIVFHPDGNRLGEFIGEVQVANEARGGDVKTSEWHAYRVAIKPSLVLRMAQPTAESCQAPVVPATTEKTPFQMRVEAIGLKSGEENAPMRFQWTFLAKHWDIESTNYGKFFNPETMVEERTAITLEQDVEFGSSSSVKPDPSSFFLVKVAEDLFGDQSIKKLETKPVPSDGNDYNAVVAVQAIDANGKAATLQVSLEVFRNASVQYDGTEYIAQRFAPVLVRHCMPGGLNGRQVEYDESESETRSRTMGYNFNANAALNLGLPKNPFSLGLNLTAAFGTNTEATISTTESTSLRTNATVLAGQQGVFYRQTSKVHRVATILGHTACGVQADLGEAILIDWLFTPEFVQGTECPPPSNLPEAGVFRPDPQGS